MILTGREIEKQVKAGRIEINPFNPEQVQPNSYDFRLGNRIKYYVNKVLDPKVKQEVLEVVIGHDGYVLYPDKIYLGHTMEVMGSDHYVPIVKGRSSTARLGLFIHVTADIIDIGSHNQWTLQLHGVHPVRVYHGMLIGQVTFWRVFGEIKLYNGKYQGSMGPCESRIYKDFEKRNKT